MRIGRPLCRCRAQGAAVGNWKPLRTVWVCTCGHPVEDHGADPVWPCLCCDCDAFCENLTDPLFDLGGS